MANFKLNQFVKKQQIKLFISVLLGCSIVLALFITLASEARLKKVKAPVDCELKPIGVESTVELVIAIPE